MEKDIRPGGGMDGAVERVVRLLEEESSPFTLQGVEGAARKLGLGVQGDLEAFAEEVLRERARRTAGLLERLWEVLEAPPPPEVEETLRKGHRVEVHYPWPAEAQGEGGEVLVWLGDKDQALRLPLPHRVRSEAFWLKASAGRARVRVGPGLFAQKEEACFLAEGLREAKWALEEVRALRPLFAALSLADLGEALEALLELEDGEARQEGPYVLARKGETRALRRGTLFQDPALDGAFLLGGEVEVSFPEGVRLLLEGGPLFEGWMGLKVGSLRWGEDLVPLARPAGYAEDRRALSRLILNGVRSRTKSHDFLYSRRTRALLEELEALDEGKDVLEVLGDRRFFARVYTRALAAL